MYFDLAQNSFLQSERDPQKRAFAAADGELSWHELKNLSDRICHTLRQLSLPKGHPILVYGDKQKFFLAALLACLREGFPFVSVTPELPPARIEAIRNKTGSGVMICAEECPVKVPVQIDVRGEITGRNAPDFEARHPDLAYIIFTSGSSGEPKGVCISRQNMLDFINWFTAEFPVSDKTVFINQASFLFDIALADFFGALQLGATCIFNSAQQNRSEEFIDRAIKYSGGYWNSTPSFLAFCLLHKNFTAPHLPSIRHFVLSGEQLSIALAKKITARFPHAELINAYGPTETTIFASRVVVANDMLDGTAVPIAAANDNRLWTEDGEIVICTQVGAYLDREAGGFINEQGKRIFRTGDLGLIKRDYIYFAGRKDRQVKLNGYRIELDEIKNVLEMQPGVSQALCVPVETQGKVRRLVAFVEAEPQAVAAIKDALAKQLPAYMIPSEIIAVSEFPHTHSFKSDSKQLLEKYLGQ